jgi:hypothetical protein
MSPKTTHRTRTSNTPETADIAIIPGNFRNGGGGRNMPADHKPVQIGDAKLFRAIPLPCIYCKYASIRCLGCMSWLPNRGALSIAVAGLRAT